jgi:RNA polymerase sigma factor (sigma-70 family)
MNPSGFDALYARQHERLVTALVLAGSDQPTAEDVAHEAFVRVLLGWRRIREPDGYLYRVAFRLHRRTSPRGAGRALSALSFVSGQRAGGPRTEDDVVRRDDVQQLLRQLSPRQRECAVLVHYLGCSTEEAAARLGIAPATVRVHLHAARAAVRQQAGQPAT